MWRYLQRHPTQDQERLNLDYRCGAYCSILLYTQLGGSYSISLSPLHTDLLCLMMQNYTKLLTFLWPENANHSHTQQLNSSQAWGTRVI